MLNSEFENRVQQQMEELKLNPADEVWENIERNLAKEKKPRRWLLYFVLLAVLMVGFLLTWNNTGDNSKQIGMSTRKQNKSDAVNIPTHGKSETIALPDTAATPNTTASILAGQKKPLVTSKDISIPPAVNTVVTATGEDANVTPANKRSSTVFKQPGKTTFVVIAPGAPGDNSKTLLKALPTGADNNITYSRSDPAVGLRHIPWSGLLPPLATYPSVHTYPDSISGPQWLSWEKGFARINTKHDSIVSTKTKIASGQTASAKWQYSINIGGGLSNQVNGLFTNRPVLADGSYNSPGSVSSPVNAIRPNEPSASAAFAMGVQLERLLGKKWRLVTGLQYLYQSSVVKTGNRVDSSATYSVGNASVTANSFYMPGTMQTYKNKSHFVHVPMLLQYALSSKFPVYLEAGPGISYLLSSNILLYNRSTNAYFTSPAAYNKLLFSFSAGAGLELNRRKQIPFRLGYRFSYGINSITKEPFGNQQMQRSILYLGIPIKK